MLIKDGQEITPDQDDDDTPEPKPEPEQPEKESADDPLADLTEEERDILLEYIREQSRAKSVKQTAPVKAPPEKPQEDYYGDYRFADQDDYPVGKEAFKQSVAKFLAHLNLKVVFAGIVIVVLLWGGYSSWKGGREEVQAQPTAQAEQAQPVQQVQPVQQSAPGCETHSSAIVEIGPDYIKYGDGYTVWVGAEAVGMYVLNQQGSYTICQ